MELQGTWTRTDEGYMDFETSLLQRLYEQITDDYHAVYNRLLAELDDEDDTFYQAQAAGYELITNDKEINGTPEFATTYLTPTYMLDIWFKTDRFTGKKMFNQGYIRIRKK
jgi:hypothetical protein